MTKTARTLKEVRIVPLGNPTDTEGGGAFADGETITATRLDGEGTAEGEIVRDDHQADYAVFAAPLAVGLWRFEVAE